MYARLAEMLASTTAIKWFPGHDVEDDWIVEAEVELGSAYHHPIAGG